MMLSITLEGMRGEGVEAIPKRTRRADLDYTLKENSSVKKKT